VSAGGIKPENITYGTLAKTYLLSGRPHCAALVVEDMLAKGLELQPELAELHIQAMLVVGHSSLKHTDMQKLERTVRRGQPIIQKASRLQQETLKSMQGVIKKLKNNPSALKLHDVLVEWKARQSEMVKWLNHNAGSCYLDDPVITRSAPS